MRPEFSTRSTLPSGMHFPPLHPLLNGAHGFIRKRRIRALCSNPK
jgi:hypothetical protein